FGFACFMRFESDAVRFDDLVVDEVDGRLGGEVAVVPFGGPGPTVVNGRAGRRGEVTHQINLDVGLLIVSKEREGFLPANDRFVARRAAHLAPGEFTLGED